MDKQDWLASALAQMHSGQWYGWKKDWTGEKRMSYENLIIIKDGASMPSETEVNAKIQEIKDSETQKANDKTSAQNKLKALGLTDAEIEAL